MSNGKQPVLRSKPGSRLDRLAALDNWTEEPVIGDRAAAGQGASEPATPHHADTGELRVPVETARQLESVMAGVDELASEISPAPIALRKRGAPPKHQRYAQQVQTNQGGPKPWAVLEQLVPMQAVSYRLPRELYLQLKYLGDTTFGKSMNDIVVEAIEKEVDRRLRERGERQ